MNSLYETINFGHGFDRVLKAEATLDFPSAAAAGTQALTVSVPGAAVGDAVLLAVPASLNAGLIPSAFVSAADTVTIRVSNITAGAIDAASAVWGVLVFKI